MKILVLSDSHASLRFMRQAIGTIRPDAVIHLGDYYDDAQALAEEYPYIPFHQVPGNCDHYRCPTTVHPVLCYDVGGVRLYMTHGHLHQVKLTLVRLLADARKMGAQAVLYGHTHCGDCHQEDDGLWVLNPGSCGSDGGSVGLIRAENGKIMQCVLLNRLDLES